MNAKKEMVYGNLSSNFVDNEITKDFLRDFYVYEKIRTFSLVESKMGAY